MTKLLRRRRILLIGEDGAIRPYVTALEKSGAEIIRINADINWQSIKFARHAADTVLNPSQGGKPDAVVVVNPGIRSPLDSEQLQTPIFKFTEYMNQQKMPLVVHDVPEMMPGAEDELDGLGMRYRHAGVKPDSVSVMVFLEIIKKHDIGRASSPPDF